MRLTYDPPPPPPKYALGNLDERTLRKLHAILGRVNRNGEVDDLEELHLLLEQELGTNPGYVCDIHSTGSGLPLLVVTKL